ncbi:MAG TPA: extracellular solute-binding protein, partial [Candidatus Brocadiia bacterium]|nr:extracellular solute-binding protein [Candidatus Brocadiia bacterium]
MKLVGVLLAVVIAAIVVLGFFVLGGDSGQQAGLVIVSPHPESVLREFAAAFSAWHEKRHGGPVNVQWEDHGGTSAITKYLYAEFKSRPQGLGIDVFWGGGFEPYVKLAEAGLLHPWKAPEDTLSKIIPDVGGVPVYDREYRWYGSALSGFGIIYNKKRLAAKGVPEPKSWQDLASPKLFGEVAAADPRRSGSAHMCYEIMLQALGYDKGWAALTLMAANARAFYEGAGDVPRNVSLGQAAAGPVIDFYAWAQIRENGPELIGFTLPQSLTVGNPDAIGVLKGAPHVQTAFRFMEFVLSPEGQRLWMLKPGAAGGPLKDELCRIPVRMDVYEQCRGQSSVRFDTAALKSDFRFSPAVDARRRAAFKDLYGAALIDAHPELVDAWEAVIARGASAKDTDALCQPFVTNDELAEMSTK